MSTDIRGNAIRTGSFIAVPYAVDGGASLRFGTVLRIETHDTKGKRLLRRRRMWVSEDDPVLLDPDTTTSNRHNGKVLAEVPTFAILMEPEEHPGGETWIRNVDNVLVVQ